MGARGLTEVLGECGQRGEGRRAAPRRRGGARRDAGAGGVARDEHERAGRWGRGAEPATLGVDEEPAIETLAQGDAPPGIGPARGAAGELNPAGAARPRWGPRGDG
jgi:hypothetical protein